jgi:hypothetical protein
MNEREIDEPMNTTWSIGNSIFCDPSPTADSGDVYIVLSTHNRRHTYPILYSLRRKR